MDLELKENKNDEKDGYLIEAICIDKWDERQYMWFDDFVGLRGPLLNSFLDE